MELVYLWVEDYKNIHKQGFNFSPRFCCEYDGETLTINENDDFIPDFFGDNINVTAIVGKNGSGKSSVLEYLIDSKNHHEVFLEVIFQDDKLYVNDNTNICNLTQYEYLQKEIKIKSSLFKTLHIPFDNDISIENNYFKSIIEYLEDGINMADYYMFQEQIYMFNIAKNNLHNIVFPKNIIFNFNVLYDSHSVDDEFGAIFNKYHKLYKQEELSILEKLYLNFFEQILRCSKTEIVKTIIKKYLHKNQDVDSAEELFIKFKPELEQTSYIQIYEKLHAIYNLIKKDIGKILPTTYNRTILSYKVPLADLPEKFIDNCAPFINFRDGQIGFMDYKWDISFSAGEQGMINIFTTLFSDLNKNPDITTIYLDEGETFLHPNWQKKYLSYIIQFIKDNFSDRKLHIVLTTHSPFLLSDIPKQNIIFLDKDKQGNCKVVDGLNDKKQTFGANIHTLLSDSFFMENGLMGEFAKNKIDKVITILNQEKPNKEDLEYCEKIIPIIGEPIVKNQLQKMLDSKKLPKVGEIDKIHEEIEALQSRLKDLEVKDDKK